MQHLLSHFKELTVLPQNAEELKGLILQLAVQGKLTKKWRLENTSNETGEELFHRITIEKERLIKEKKYKAKYDTDRFEPLIERPRIPDTWIYVTVGNICELLTGATPSKTKSEYFDGNIKWLVSGDIHKGYINDCAGRITQLGMESSNCKILPVDSIMIALNGQGKTRATVALLKTEATCNQSLVAMKPFIDDSNLSEYIYYLLKGKYYQIRDITGQKQRRGLNMTLVSQLPVALPPLEEQKAIVSIVNQLFAEVEQLEAATKERVRLKEDYVTSALSRITEGNTVQEWAALQPHFKTFFTETQNIKSLRESILQLAVQGKLTRNWRKAHPELIKGDHSAKALLERIKVEKARLIADKKIKKEKPLPAINEDEIPYELPEGWEWCRLGELITFLNGYAYKSSTYVEDSKFQVIRLGNVKNDRFLIDAKQAYVPEAIGSKTLDYKLYKGDILTTLTGTKNKRDYCFTCLVKSEHLESRTLLLNQRVGCIRPIDFDSSELMNKFLKSNVELDQLFATESGTANQGNIGSNAFKNLVYPLPPKEEQNAIVQKVNALMALFDRLESEIETQQSTQEQWMKSCLIGNFNNKQK